ncbi:hypothetical protein HYN59_01715 [Flavobacterium album]|uniref:Uncharacterized protein n=1 Tax=Flavobacterium album TaxID=2175091 RepID=A0A2S1QU23_9FLAO|nr:hypothetical protein HYN59_01715 [Flavobacterium album]
MTATLLSIVKRPSLKGRLRFSLSKNIALNAGAKVGTYSAFPNFSTPFFYLFSSLFLNSLLTWFLTTKVFLDFFVPQSFTEEAQSSTEVFIYNIGIEDTKVFASTAQVERPNPRPPMNRDELSPQEGSETCLPNRHTI